VLVSLKLIDQLFLKLPERSGVGESAVCWEKWDVAQFAEIFTRQGFEVESTTRRGEEFAQVVVGCILTAERHPKADKLQVCQVETGPGETRQIVCGAANARAGLYVAVALPGAKLPNGLEIKVSKIRDVESHGMLCSREELGLPIDTERDGSGIWELHHEPSCGRPEGELRQRLGHPVFIALGLDDVLFELNVTPNRPDLLCHEGAARELSAGLRWAGVSATGKEWNGSWLASQTAEKILADASQYNCLETANGAFVASNELGAPTFFVALDNVKVGTTPAWLRNALEALGQKSINSVVDACNLVLLCFAQPNHAFDVGKIAANADGKKRLCLRFANLGESFLGLDGKERSLAVSDCVVADSQRPQALLGVIGGELSKVDSSSTSLVLEFANPHPVLVRRTSRRHGRKTDSSFAFEKGIDVWRRAEAARCLIGLISAFQPQGAGDVKYSGAMLAKPSKNRSSEAMIFFPVVLNGEEPSLAKESSEFTISFSSDDVRLRVGAELVPFERQLQILDALGFRIAMKKTDPPSAEIVVPSWRRLDVVGAADLTEEIVRVVGIDHVPAHPLHSAGQLTLDDPHLALFESIALRLVNLGYHETSGFHFMRADDWSRLRLNNLNACGEPIALLNPIIKDEPLMQTTLLSGLLRKVAYNLNYGTKRGQLYELTRAFQNRSFEGKRVFPDNGEGIGLAEQLAAGVHSAMYEYDSKHSMLLSHEQGASSERPAETTRVCGVVFGSEEEKEWFNSGEREWSYHKLAAHVAEVVSVFGMGCRFVELPSDHPMKPALHPGRSAAVVLDSASGLVHLGWVGQFHPATLRNFEIEASCYGFEINLALSFRLMKDRKDVQATERVLSVAAGGGINAIRLPSVERDFAFLVDETLSAEQLVSVCREAVEADALQAKKIPARLISVRIFDVYRGQGVPAGKKSVALRCALLPTERTLVDADIQTVVEATVDRVTRECAAQLRG
jgi:phenylalanyl-tRNA synthetase beta chain